MNDTLLFIILLLGETGLGCCLGDGGVTIGGGGGVLGGLGVVSFDLVGVVLNLLLFGLISPSLP